MINALVERFRLEREMTKAGVIKENFVFDVVYPSIGVGLIFGSYRWEYLLGRVNTKVRSRQQKQKAGSPRK